MKKIVLSLFIVMLLFSCGSSPGGGQGKTPVWVNDINSAYPEDQFIAALGQGDSLKEAKANAASTLATRFKVRIEVDSSLISRYQEYSDNGIVTSNKETIMASDINQSTDQTLKNIQYGETYTDDLGMVFTVAYLNRKETAGLYKKSILSNADTVKHLISRSDNISDMLEKYAYLDAAYVVAQNNEILIETLAVISSSTAGSLSLGYSLKSLKTKRSDLASQMVFRISISGDNDNRITDMTADLLTSQGFKVSSSGALTVEGSVKTEVVDLDNGYDNIKWYLVLNILDESGIQVVSLEKNNRSSGISASSAEARAFKDMDKSIDKKFLRKLTAYFDGFIEK